MLMYKRIRELCEERQVTMRQLIKNAGLSEGAYRWKDGEKEPSLESIVKVCEYFSIPLEEFFNKVEGTQLTTEQKNLLSRWRSLGEVERKTLTQILDAFDKMKRKKTEQ